ncbi:MAG: hypothetical protein V1685_00420 [Parcubacteria group bacterium]
MKKCSKCGAPLDGFLAKIARLAGVKPSVTNPDVCNKCEGSLSAPVKPVEPSTPISPISPVTPDAPSDEPKNDITL